MSVMTYDYYIYEFSFMTRVSLRLKDLNTLFLNSLKNKNIFHENIIFL